MTTVGKQDFFWYAARTRSNFEKRVTEEIRAKGFEPYCPVFEEAHEWADRRKIVERPVFPGYVFVRFDNTPAARLSLLRTAGVVGFLGVDGIPEPIPNAEIEPVRRMLRGGLGVMGHPFLTAGAWVRVKRGALKGVEGRFVRAKNGSRLIVSISLLSQSIAAEVDARNVEVITSKPQHSSVVEAA